MTTADASKSLRLFSVFHNLKYEHLLAGVSGGVLSTLILHPLDLLKIRFSVSDGLSSRPTYHGMLHALGSIWRQHGLAGLYQGVLPNVWGAGASWGLYFFFYNAIKVYMQDGSNTSLGPGRHMLAAAESGAITLLFTNPIWVVKTRLCLQYEGIAKGSLPPAGQSSVHYKGMLDALFKIYSKEGIPGLYKGLTPGLFGVSHGAIQFMGYEELKKLYTARYNLPINSKLGAMEYIMFAALSKFVAVSITYPYQVVRSRLQDQHKQYTGITHVIRHTWRYEGMRGFYKGLLPNLIRVVPATCITFVVYEKITQLLLKPDEKT